VISLKALTAAAAVLAFILAFGTFSYYYLDSSAKNLLAEAEITEKHVQTGQWDQARERFGRFQKSWETTAKKWTVLIDHQELDEINVSMAKIREFIITENGPELMAELAELKLLLKHIPEKEALNIKNVL